MPNTRPKLIGVLHPSARVSLDMFREEGERTGRAYFNNRDRCRISHLSPRRGSCSGIIHVPEGWPGYTRITRQYYIIAPWNATVAAPTIQYKTGHLETVNTSC